MRRIHSTRTRSDRRGQGPSRFGPGHAPRRYLEAQAGGRPATLGPERVQYLRRLTLRIRWKLCHNCAGPNLSVVAKACPLSADMPKKHRPRIAGAIFKTAALPVRSSPPNYAALELTAAGVA